MRVHATTHTRLDELLAARRAKQRAATELRGSPEPVSFLVSESLRLRLAAAKKREQDAYTRLWLAIEKAPVEEMEEAT